MFTPPALVVLLLSLAPTCVWGFVPPWDRDKMERDKAKDSAWSRTLEILWVSCRVAVKHLVKCLPGLPVRMGVGSSCRESEDVLCCCTSAEYFQGSRGLLPG